MLLSEEEKSSIIKERKELEANILDLIIKLDYTALDSPERKALIEEIESIIPVECEHGRHWAASCLDCDDIDSQLYGPKCESCGDNEFELIDGQCNKCISNEF